MPLTDISRVTTAITTLIRQAIARDNFPDPFDVSAAPPDDDSNPSPNVISLYLFHIIEDRFRKNLPPLRPVQTNTPVQYTEMGLTLNYVVTARNISATRRRRPRSVRAAAARLCSPRSARLPGDHGQHGRAACAAQPAEHSDLRNGESGGRKQPDRDHPAAGDHRGDGELLERRTGSDGPARAVLRSSGDSARAHLPSPRLTGIVYSLGGFVSVSGQPFLESVRNMVGFIPPPGFAPSNPCCAVPVSGCESSTGRAVSGRRLVLPPEVPPENNGFRASGSDLRDERTYLAMSGQAGIGAAAPTEMSFRIDTGSGANPDWTFDVRDTEINVSMRQAVQDDQGTALTIYPGLFSLRVVTAKQLPNDPNGRLIEQSSNEQVFAIIPQIVSIARDWADLRTRGSSG